MTVSVGGNFFRTGVVEAMMPEQLVVRLALTVGLAVAIAGCSSTERTTSSPTSSSRLAAPSPLPLAGRAGSAKASAKAEPDAVRPWGRMVVTPADAVERTCADVSPLDRIEPDGTAVGIGWLGGGYWEPGSSAPSRLNPACLVGEPNAAPVAFVVPSVSAGTYRICLGAVRFVPEGCAVFTVLEPGPLSTVSGEPAATAEPATVPRRGAVHRHTSGRHTPGVQRRVAPRPRRTRRRSRRRGPGRIPIELATPRGPAADVERLLGIPQRQTGRVCAARDAGGHLPALPCADPRGLCSPHCATTRLNGHQVAKESVDENHAKIGQPRATRRTNSR